MNISLLNLAVLATSVIAALAVYLDAVRLGIGRRHGRVAWQNLSPGAWGIVGLVFSWPGIVLYLAARAKLRGTADADAPRGTLVFGALAVAACAALAWAATQVMTPPACDYEALLAEINARVRAAGFADVRLPEERDATRTSRTCRYASHDAYDAEVSIDVSVVMQPAGREIRLESRTALPPCRSPRLRADATQLLSVTGVGELEEGTEVWSAADSRLCRFVPVKLVAGRPPAWLVNVVREPRGFRLVPKPE